jgi:ATP-dependent DNA helicase RecG
VIEVQSLTDLETLAETVELECKLAAGSDGKGQLPKDFWPTYSAFANTHGGIILLGIKEKQGRFSVNGVAEPQRLITDIFNMLNNPQKVSTNLLTDADVTLLTINDQTIIQVRVPAAHRKHKPVYLNGNPFQGNTYRRLHEGDRPCDDETVKRMLAEQVEDERDNKILPGFTLEDLEPESLRIYRQMLRDAKPEHPWLELEDGPFLNKLKGSRRDRQTGVEGLTIAGLLMFGRWENIQEAVPHYFVDYQERLEAGTAKRWIDRLIPDGTWSGNLFDFYRRVYRKLTSDLKVPFVIKAGQRQDDSPVHEAIREALVNTLVHADYTGRVSVMVVKRPGMFGFRNPGNMRISLKQALQGGESDCRNRIIHQMFLMIGLGERAGSGIPKIYSGWESQHWRPPALYEKDDPEQTRLVLRMLDLLPPTVVYDLQTKFGSKFNCLSELDRLILTTAAIEGLVTHVRMQELTTKHNHDLTLALQRLVKAEFLESSGKTRGTVYTLPGTRLPTPDTVFEPQAISPPLRTQLSLEHLLESSEHLLESSEHLGESSEHLGESSEHLSGYRDKSGCLVTPHLQAPIIDSIEALAETFRQELEHLASEPRNKRKLPREKMKSVILAVSREQYLTLNALAQLVNRDQDALRQQYLNEMVKTHELALAFPSTPNHPQQAYIAKH